MKNAFIAIIFLVLLSFSVMAQSPSPTVNPSPDLTAAQEIKSAREVLKQVVDKEDSGNKTFADVLDKGIDLFASYATSMGEIVKKVAPEVWEIMIRQQYAIAIPDILYWLMLPFIFLISPFIHRRLFYGKDSKVPILDTASSDESEVFRCIVAWVCFIVATLSVFIALHSITSDVAILLNPKYYAIKDMFNLIK